MSLDYFTSRLAPVASVAYQRKFGVSGTAAEYIIASELLQGAWECIERLEGHFPQAAALNGQAQSFGAPVKAELRCIGDLLRSPESQDLEILSWAALLQNPTWQKLSLHARFALSALGFDLTAWEQSEVGEYRVP
ncbi:hypothetical protein IAI53_07255 [Thauera sp. CAU 1555]|uniref:Uncharacterized protein n=1 Tax=Thauera sedimentorum TaxID=2767595 RepID=A0ABR9B8N1_9RHOO|nr:hypothetical protein [Thauera sedimentorum]MBC9071761.1 hypothetical protein [Thauera sedimentorum]MBD8502680.1 hypothetical protein [Thauera sedimentorum]